MRNSFVVYRSYYEAIQNLNNEERGILFSAICEYGLDGTEPEFEGHFKMFWTMLKPTLDKSIARYNTNVENGSKGGRPPKTKTQPKPNQNPTKTSAKANDNLNYNDNVNDNYNENDNNATNVAATTATTLISSNGKYGDDVLYNDCLKYQKDNPNKYDKEMYVEFLEYWTATIQTGKDKGKELWRCEKTWSLAGRLRSSYELIWKPKQVANPKGNSQKFIIY